MRVSVIGAGYVGLVTGACLAERGHQVVCVDVDPLKVDAINGARSPIHEAGLDELLRKHAGVSLCARVDVQSAVEESDLSLIAVGTPFDGTAIDLSQVREASRQIGVALSRKKTYHVVVVKSTVVPGTTDKVVLPILEEYSGGKAGEDFGVGMNPEFLTEGQAVGDFMFPDRIVIGSLDRRSGQAIEQLYEGFDRVPRVRTNVRTAEMIKYTANALLATLISFSNEIGNLCAAMGGVDVVEVMEGVHLSGYLSPTNSEGGRQLAPIASFLAAGCGYGGSCLPKDVKALIAHGRKYSQAMSLLEAVDRINCAQPGVIIQLLKRHYPDLKGRNIAILGLAFRPDTGDIRESPAIPIIQILLKEGANIKAYDPVAMGEVRRLINGERIRYCQGLEDVSHGTDAVLLITRWDEFRRLPQVLASVKPPPLVVDGRRMLNKRDVLRYEGVGLGEDAREVR
ncbi:MAG: UDP-glucose/GDP-mannose dehydrogenase family protein [Acidobacteriota bacterium]